MKHSPRPSKRVLWNFVSEYFDRHPAHGTVLDAACGRMRFRKFFRNNAYIGVDSDEERISSAATRHPDAHGVVAKIEEMPASIQGDTVLCLETIGVNNHFDVNNTMFCVQKLCNATREGGVLVLNIGPQSAPFRDDVENVLSKSFDRYDAYEYGRFSNKYPGPIAKFLTTVMLRFPPLRASSRTPYVFFAARDKKPNLGWAD